MVVDDFDVVSVTCLPSEADTPLIVDPDAPLSRAITSKSLETVPRRNSKIVQGDGGIELPELAQRDTLDV